MKLKELAKYANKAVEQGYGELPVVTIYPEGHEGACYAELWQTAEEPSRDPTLSWSIVRVVPSYCEDAWRGGDSREVLFIGVSHHYRQDLDYYEELEDMS